MVTDNEELSLKRRLFVFLLSIFRKLIIIQIWEEKRDRQLNLDFMRFLRARAVWLFLVRNGSEYMGKGRMPCTSIIFLRLDIADRAMAK